MKIVKLGIQGVFGLIFVCIVGYLLLPIQRFPVSPSDSVQSLEDADTETPLRRAYFTNFNREDVLKHYQSQMDQSVFGIPLPTYRLNYPPEDAYTLIRDQTRSTYLEEIVHPLRESLFINGFVPREAKDAIGYRGIRFEAKITIKHAPSSALTRLLVFGVSMLALWNIFRELGDSTRRIYREWFF